MSFSSSSYHEEEFSEGGEGSVHVHETRRTGLLGVMGGYTCVMGIGIVMEGGEVHRRRHARRWGIDIAAEFGTQLDWVGSEVVMVKAFRRRRSRTSLLAFILPQTLQSQIPTVFIFTTYLPQNSHKHLLRRLTFIFSIWLCQLSP